MLNKLSQTKIVDITVPILFLTFNRPDETRASFQAIRDSKPKILFIASDGPRESSTKDAHLVAEVRKIIQNVDWDCKCEYLLRDTNLGCGLGVSGALNWFFERVEYGIILEDDCIPNASFFIFCQEMLLRYRFTEKIMAIAGTNITKGISYDTDYVYTNFPIMWGWATWQRAWKKYDYQIKEWPVVKKDKSLSKHSYDKWKIHPVHIEFFDRTYERVRDNSMDTWDHQWIFCNWINNGFTVTTTKNLVSNIGFGFNATHTVYDKLGRGNFKTYSSMPPYSGPNEISAHKKTDAYINKYWLRATWRYYLKIILLKVKIISYIWEIVKKYKFKLIS